MEALILALGRSQDAQTNFHKSNILSAQAGNTVVGVYLGARLDRQSTASEVLGQAKHYIKTFGAVKILIGQSCGNNIPADYVAGVVIDSSGRSAFESVRVNLNAWTEARCVQDARDVYRLAAPKEASSSVWLNPENYEILDKIMNWAGKPQ
ncbi:hypothetical protein LEL_04124 [Akanthomyces lecanii RCEF 1005]|uniref:Uncharacterized protein n=1 Tax=Akanthomyces lecanii RCEF 1005 TaxID=1081108 RepID=A0A168H4Q4_CORDF|nr:hypothetical protein LEL_04124 [Akanthomyces lecanii RCEF 1005]